MPKPDATQTLRNLDRRLSTVEQVLPTLATKDELNAAVAPLPTREEMRTAIRAEGEETRRHFDVVAESLRSDHRIIADGHGHLTHRIDTLEGETKRAIAGLDRRVMRLEGRSGR